MSNYTPTPTRLVPGVAVAIPGGGEPPSGATFGAPHEVELDAIAFLDAAIVEPEAGVVRHQWRPVPIIGDAAVISVPLGGGLELPAIQCVTTHAYGFLLELDLADGATFTQVRVYGRRMPATKLLEVFKVNMTAWADIGSGNGYYPLVTSLGTDATATVVGSTDGDISYLSVSPAAEVVNRTSSRYFARVTATETGDLTHWFDAMTTTTTALPVRAL